MSFKANQGSAHSLPLLENIRENVEKMLEKIEGFFQDVGGDWMGARKEIPPPFLYSFSVPGKTSQHPSP